MYKGEPIKGIEFYTLLIESDEFTSELGKVALVSGKLEAELIIFLRHNRIKGNYDRATLGNLIDMAEKNNLLDKSMIIALRDTATKRNYITHNIYALFTDQIDETIMEKSNLLDSDVHLYMERAWQLKENLNSLADLIKKKNIIE
jgi:hypothetical protein